MIHLNKGISELNIRIGFISFISYQGNLLNCISGYGKNHKTFNKALNVYDRKKVIYETMASRSHIL